MRKIIEPSEKKYRKQIIIGAVLILIMVLSILGYSLESHQSADSNSEKITYNGFEFIGQNDLWLTTYEDNNLAFLYNPKEVNMPGNVRKISSYYNKPVYIYSENSEAEAEIARNLYPFVQRVQKGCIEGEICKDDSPVKNCTDNLIVIKEQNKSGVIQDNNCILIYGQNEDLLKNTDGFLFKTLGIS